MSSPLTLQKLQMYQRGKNYKLRDHQTVVSFELLSHHCHNDICHLRLTYHGVVV